MILGFFDLLPNHTQSLLQELGGLFAVRPLESHGVDLDFSGSCDDDCDSRNYTSSTMDSGGGVSFLQIEDIYRYMEPALIDELKAGLSGHVEVQEWSKMTRLRSWELRKDRGHGANHPRTRRGPPIHQAKE